MRHNIDKQVNIQRMQMNFGDSITYVANAKRKTIFQNDCSCNLIKINIKMLSTASKMRDTEIGVLLLQFRLAGILRVRIMDTIFMT